MSSVEMATKTLGANPVGLALDAFFMIGTYKDERENGASVPGAMANAAISQLAFSVMPGDKVGKAIGQGIGGFAGKKLGATKIGAKAGGAIKESWVGKNLLKESLASNKGNLGKTIGGGIGTMAGQIGAMMLVTAAEMVGGAIVEGSRQNVQEAIELRDVGYGKTGSRNFQLSNAGYTMRQRSIQKMRETGQNINSVLGNEARNYIRSSDGLHGRW